MNKEQRIQHAAYAQRGVLPLVLGMPSTASVAVDCVLVNVSHRRQVMLCLGSACQHHYLRQQNQSMLTDMPKFSVFQHHHHYFETMPTHATEGGL